MQAQGLSHLDFLLLDRLRKKSFSWKAERRTVRERNPVVELHYWFNAYSLKFRGKV